MNQSRLVSTAPVFKPDPGRGSSAGEGGRWSVSRGGGRGRILNSNSSARGYDSFSADRELKKLDAAFTAMELHVNEQKEAAQKWIRLQRIRMEVRIV